MDNKHDILQLLRKVADGSASPEEALLKLKEEPFEDLDYAKIDYHRSIRQGAAEVIYGGGSGAYGGSPGKQGYKTVRCRGGRAAPAAVQSGCTDERQMRDRSGRDGRRPGFRDRRPCGLPGDCRAHQCGIRRQLRRAFRSSVHAQFLCFRMQCGKY